MTTITNAMLNHYNQLAACAEAETLQECIARVEAAECRAEAAELALSQERFMRQAAEAEVARLRAELEVAKGEAAEWEALWRQDAAGG